jgi:AcrR family transcriptional regulator
MAKGRPRERLLAAADELFRAEGVAAVGVGRVIEHAEVAQMSLWRVFGSKQGLVDEWLRGVDERGLAQLRAALQGAAAPRVKLAAVFDAWASRADDRGFRGCPLVNAAAEPGGAGPAAVAVAREHKQETQGLLAALAGEAGLAEPAAIALQWLFLMEGCAVAVGLGVVAKDAAAAARAAALTLFDAAPRARSVRSGRGAPATAGSGAVAAPRRSRAGRRPPS